MTFADIWTARRNEINIDDNYVPDPVTFSCGDTNTVLHCLL
jgi:hypothetical protein